MKKSLDDRHVPGLDAALLKQRIRARVLGDEPASVTLGRFEIVRRRGGGGQGLVYEAFDPVCDRRLALKLLNPEKTLDTSALQREFRALAGIVHPNLVALHELFCVQRQWFFTMELLVGVDFVSHLRRLEQAEPWTSDAALREALHQLLSGVSAIHASGKVHRDLKPSNVLVEPDGRVVIIDYGLVVDAAVAPRAPARSRSAPSGTPAYMAPEQAAGGPADAASDMYAVGVILCEALTARRPQPERERNAPFGGTELQLLCRQLLARDPAARPTAAQALAMFAGAPSAPARAGGQQRVATAASPCFVGRAEPLRALAVLLERAQRASPQFALVHGESGVGKTTLLRQAGAQLALTQGALVLEGRCYEHEHIPYKVLHAVATELVQRLNQLPDAQVLACGPARIAPLLPAVPALSRLRVLSAVARDAAPSGQPQELRAQAFTALRELLRLLAAHTRLVVVVDDLQWADLDSFALLEHVFAEAAPLLFVGSYRRDERGASPFLRLALAEAGLPSLACDVTELAVDPFDAGEALALLQKLVPGARCPEQDELAALIQGARGLPFLLEELAHVLRSRPAAGSGDVAQLLARRRSACTLAASRLLELLCLAGRPLELAFLQQALGPASDAFQAAAELRGLRLVRWRASERACQLEPYHDLVRQAVLRGLLPAQRRELHATLASAIERACPEQHEHLLEHLLALGARARAAACAELAAEAAASKFAWERAHELFALTLDLSDGDLRAGARLTTRLADVCSFMGRHADAAAAYLVAAERAAQAERLAARTTAGVQRDPAQPGEDALRGRAARQFLRAGRVSEGNALLRAALRKAGLRYPRSSAGAAALLLIELARGRLSRSQEPRPASRRAAGSRARLEALEAAHGELWFSDPLRGALIHAWYYRDASRCEDRHLSRALTAQIIYLALWRGHTGQRQIARVRHKLNRLGAKLGTPYDEAVVDLAQAVSLIHCEWRPRAALPALARAERLLVGHCPGTQFERNWLQLLREYAQEATGDLPALVVAARANERAASGQGANALHRLLVSVPLAMLIENRPDSALEFIEAHWRWSTRRIDMTGYVAVVRKCNALLFLGRVREACAFFSRQLSPLPFTRLAAGQVTSNNYAFHRARNAAALYWYERSPRLAREVRARARSARGLPPLARGLYTLAEASVARAERRDHDCRGLLEAALRDFRAGQGDHAEWCARYRLAQLDGSAERLASARDWFTARGVGDPERWIGLSAPGPTGWR